MKEIKASRRRAAKKPRTLNAVWADAQCDEWDDGTRGVFISVRPHPQGLTAKRLLRLSQWLAEAAAWKGEG